MHYNPGMKALSRTIVRRFGVTKLGDYGLPNHGLRIQPEARGKRLAAWMNLEHRHPLSKRFVQTILRIQDLIRLREQMPADVPANFKVPADWKNRYLRLCAQVGAGLNALPQNYHVGGVLPTPFGPHVIISVLHVIPGAPFKTCLAFGCAVSDLFALSEEMLLGRLRRCAHCQRWFYALKSHGRFCSVACQQEHYKSSPKSKQYRARYMREYRSRQKEVGG
jgi:hypothetical protein